MLARIIYTLALTIVSPMLLFSLYRHKQNKPKFGSRWKEHFGITPRLNSTERPVWIHAVSVGECIAAIPLIKALKVQDPEQPILVTTTTSTGAEQILKLGDLVEHRYMPIDFGFTISRFLKVVKPKELLIIETELWPNTLHYVHQKGIPIILVNARLSNKSYQRYAKAQWLFNLFLPCLTKVLCQNESDARRFARLGVSSERLVVTGSMKLDISISDKVKGQAKALRSMLGPIRPIWVAASTHKGEEEHIVTAHKMVLSKHPNALLLLVPRHPERFNSVFELCNKQGLTTVRRTSGFRVSDNTQVYLADTMGEMFTIIGAADVCFMGGSLVGNKVGGHNVLEPAALGIPTIIGPSYFNFKELVEKLYAQNGIWVRSPETLGEDVCTLLADFQTRKKLADNGVLFVQKNKGALKKTLEAFR